MKNSGPPSPKISAGGDKLDFPVDSTFVSEPPKVDFEAMVRRIEANLAERNSRPGETERRLREKIDVEFVLKD